ncbi:MAG TPA: STAS/SEC14 domain-containing protein [Bacteroidia bacterium]
MHSPAGKQIFEGEIANYWFDNDILVSDSKSIRRTVENIRGNVALVKQLTNNKKVPLLIYLKRSPVPDKATRKFSSEQLPVIYKAMAMVSEPGLAQLIMSILFKFRKPPIPMKSFFNDQDAKEWLKQFI